MNSDSSKEDINSLPAGIHSVTGFVSELESVRGIAICLVLIYHALPFAFSPKPQQGLLTVFPLRFFYEGHSGVSLFLVLSAFLLSLPYWRHLTGGKHPEINKYYYRRALRILPLYYSVVLVAALVTQDYSGSLRASVFLASGMDVFPFSTVWWSLQAEVQFYFVLPLIGLMILNKRMHSLLWVLLCMYQATYFYFAFNSWPGVGGLVTQIKYSHSLFGRGVVFLPGLFAAGIYVLHGNRLKVWLRDLKFMRYGGADLLMLGPIIALDQILSYNVSGIGYFSAEINNHYYHVLEGIIWSVFLLCILLAPLRLKRLLCNRFFSGMGIISYSIYLIHYPILFFGFDAFKARYAQLLDTSETIRLFFTLLLIAVIIISSMFSYTVIEKPFLRRKERLYQV